MEEWMLQECRKGIEGGFAGDFEFWVIVFENLVAFLV